MRRIRRLVVHCSATRPAVDIGAATIDRWHREMGWSGIGYHFVIRRDGTVEKGRPIERPGSHVKGHNADSLGICMVGGVDDRNRAADNFTHPQYAALRVLLEDLLADFPGADILGHRDLSPDANGDGKIDGRDWVKMCPSFDVRQWWGGH